MWEKPSNFDELCEIYLKTKLRTNSKMQGIKAMRDFSSISLAEAKNMMYWIEDGCDIVEAQGRLFGDLESLDLQANDKAQAE